MYRTLAFLAVVTAPASLLAQSAPQALQLASVEPLPIAAVAITILPDAPSALVASSSTDATPEEQAGIASGSGNPNSTVAPKYAGIVLPGQTASRLTRGEKVVYGFKDAFSPLALAGITISAAYSQGVDSAPHYGQGWSNFGKREGVSALRSTIQSFTSDAVFSPIFHDDPRYYELGQQHNFVNRVFYAATRVIVTRTDAGHNTLNAPLLLGYGVAAGMNNLYYPDRDTGAKPTFVSYAGSLGGAVLGMEANEFLDDALRMVHLRK